MTDAELAARALRHRADEAELLAARMAAKGVYTTAPAALQAEADACRRVAETLAPFVPGNHHG
jgi:hypothetical protein